MSDRMEVVISGSRNLYCWFPCMYMSLFEHNPDAHLWILAEDDALPYETPENVEIVNVSKQTLFRPDGPNMRSAFTYLAMIRAAYPILFNGAAENLCGVRSLTKLDRVISMDCDVVVCDSLQPIWETDLTGKWFSAVAQFKSIDRPLGVNHEYNNMGVTVFNLEQMRADGVAERAVAMLNSKRFTFVDEEVLNILNVADGENRCVNMPPRFNEHLEVSQSLKPAVVHYAGEKCVWKMDLDRVYRDGICVYIMRILLQCAGPRARCHHYTKNPR